VPVAAAAAACACVSEAVWDLEELVSLESATRVRSHFVWKERER